MRAVCSWLVKAISSSSSGYRSIGLDWTGMDWNGMEWNGLEKLSGREVLLSPSLTLSIQIQSSLSSKNLALHI